MSDPVLPSTSAGRKRRPAIVGPSAYKRWRAALKRLKADRTGEERTVLYLAEFEAVMNDWRGERRDFKKVLRGR